MKWNRVQITYGISRPFSEQPLSELLFQRRAKKCWMVTCRHVNI